MKQWTLSTLAVLVSVAIALSVFRADAPAEDATPPGKPHRVDYAISDPRWGAVYASTGAMTNFTEVMRKVLAHVKGTREAHGYGVWDARIFIPRGRYEADEKIPPPLSTSTVRNACHDGRRGRASDGKRGRGSN